MPDLKIEIENIKSIKSFSLEIPIEQGLYAIAGTNGVGKSTIMALLAIPFRPALLSDLFGNCGHDSKINYFYSGKEDHWEKNESRWQIKGKPAKEIKIDGFIEGSIIHGTRFSDSTLESLKLSDKVRDEHLVDADEFINENFNEILHGRKNVYPTIKKVRNRRVASQLGFETVPYFMEYTDRRLSQYWLSTGENLLLSLLHFLNNKIFQQKRKGTENRSFILIDEVELALHPVAINRLLIFLKSIAKEYNLAVYFSTHSTELLRGIKPDNIYYLQNLPDRSIEVINPCYPAYATRFLYNQDSYDFLILCEDELAKFVVDKVVISERLYGGKLYHILPCGDWRNTVRLHQEIIESNLASKAAKIISVLDGDIEEQFEKTKKHDEDLSRINVTFLPIPSLEKYLHKHLVEEVDPILFREINDRFFRKKSLDEIVSIYQNGKIDRKGKKLWDLMVDSAGGDGMDENEFLREICNSIYERVSTDSLSRRIRAMF
ncbi:AAA family ATPase [Marinobacterium stanieri]|uniref:AAA family ATPase n=1 Tax=Marinobacterium stanieri TaxID=49186 RepID=UPI003A8F724B